MAPFGQGVATPMQNNKNILKIKYLDSVVNVKRSNFTIIIS